MNKQELKRIIKEEVRKVLKEALKPINTFNKVALGRMLTSIGFPVSDVSTQDRLMIVNFRTPLQNAQKFLDAYQTFKEENPGLTNMLPNIVNAKKVGDMWHFEMEA